jgi:hypothetical protein
VVSSSVLASEQDIVIAEFVSPYLFAEKYVLEFVQSKPASIFYNQVDPYGRVGLQGGWQLADAPDGNGVLVTGTMNLKTVFWRPFWGRSRVRRVLQRRLDAIRQLFSDAPPLRLDTSPLDARLNHGTSAQQQ